MTWTDFFLYLALFYVVYYAANVIIDVLRKPKIAGVQEKDSYTFESDLTDFDEQPTVIEDDDPMPLKTEVTAKGESSNKDSEEFEINEVNPVKSSGGVTNIDSLFALAKEGTIELKKSIVYS